MARTLTIRSVDVHYDGTAANGINGWTAHYRHANTDQSEDYRDGDTPEFKSSVMPTEIQVIAACKDDIQNKGAGDGAREKYAGAYDAETWSN